MRKSTMRMGKSGFTMIELIFVIVIMGILAAVAMPKFVNVQDDAKVSSEKQVIGAIRSTVGMLHGKAIIKNKDFVTKITGADANPTTQTLTVTVTDELYPTALSVTTDSASTSKTGVDNTSTNSPTGQNIDYVTSATASDGGTDFDNTTNGEATLAVVLEYEGRTDWKTGQTETAAGTAGVYSSGATYFKQLLEGPASQATGVKDDYLVDEFEIDKDGAWQYDSISGTITYRKDDGAGNTPPTALTYTGSTN